MDNNTNKREPRINVLSAIIGSIFALILLILPVGFYSGFLSWRPVPFPIALICLIVLFITPGLSEEFVFRFFLFPKNNQIKNIWYWLHVIVSALLYIAYHYLLFTRFYPKEFAFMFNIGFIIGLLSLAIVTSFLRIVTNKLWPGIFVHWLADSVQIVFLGGYYTALESGVLDSTIYGIF